MLLNRHREIKMLTDEIKMLKLLLFKMTKLSLKYCMKRHDLKKIL